MEKHERVYVDWAAATPLLPEAKAAMEPFLAGDFGNPSAIHREGQVAKQAVEGARDKVARALEVRQEYVTFTSGGTEGNNLVIFGVIEALRQHGRNMSDMEVVTTRIEHPSVYRAMHRLEQMGVTVKYVSVHETGLIALADLEQHITEKTVLVSYAYVNSEIGAIQHNHAIHKTIRAAEQRFGTHILSHVDGAQAPLWLTCQFDTVGADFLVLDAAKCCGPKGVGVLVRSRRAQVVPTVFGGGQEDGLRPGTENVAGVVGAAAAIEWAQANWRARAEHVCAVRDEAIAYIRQEIPEVLLNGATGEDRVANNINISIPGLDTEFAAVVLDTAGFAVSTKSACSGAGGGESTVVLETTSDPARAASTLRFTLGPDTTIEELQQLTKALKQHITKMQSVDKLKY